MSSRGMRSSSSEDRRIPNARRRSLAPEGVQARALGAEPGAMAPLVAHEVPDVRPEAGAVVQLAQVGALVGGHVVGDLERGQGETPGIAHLPGGPPRAGLARAPTG